MNTYSSWVTEYIEESRQLRALAFWADGQPVEEFQLDITGTPCEAVIESASLVHYPDNIFELFPDRPMVKKFSAVIYDPFEDTFKELTGTGLALGVDENYAYEEYRKTGLARGQIIARGTDGIWESFNRAGQMFGKDRFRKIIREKAGLTASEIIDAVYRELNT